MTLGRVQFSIPGNPRAKQRPREGQGRFFTPKETEAEEAFVHQLGRRAMAGRAVFLGPVMLEFEAVFEMPISWPPRVREMRQLPHVSKPDLDNIEKLLLDALNGVVFADDSQICEVRKRKRYGDAARVDIVLRELATTADHPAVRRATKRAAEPPRAETKQAKRRRTVKARPADKPIGRRLR